MQHNLNYMGDSMSPSVVSGMATSTLGVVAAVGVNSSSRRNQLITYELERKNMNTGFGFDLKGDRPCIISAVHPGTVAFESGLTEGDLVIAINNRKCIDLDHQQVVSLISRCKHKLDLKVAKSTATAAICKVPKTALATTTNSRTLKANQARKVLAKKSKKFTSKGLNWVMDSNLLL